jgi:hypothetical protein
LASQTLVDGYFTNVEVAEFLTGVGNGLKAHHCFGRSRDRPKPAGFGEVTRACWMMGGSAVG